MKFGHQKLYIGGELTEAENGEAYNIVCPADETIAATIAWASEADTQNALETAQKGFQYWSQLPLEERLKWIDHLRTKLIENEELLRTAIMYEMGKVWEGTKEDFTSMTNSLQYYSEEIQKRKPIPITDREGTHKHEMIFQPLGVVVAFLAYNFPLLNLGFKLGPALAAGCSIIIKPSEFSPLSAYIIGKLCAEIDFPKGVINVICGSVQEVGIPLCESKIPRLITMIGSTETAQNLIAQSSRTSIKRYSMECGGNAPFIVFPDANLDAAVELAAALKIGNSGQICVAPNRFFIHESIVVSFTKKLKEKFEKVKLGFGRENQADMGPLANKQSVHKVHKIVETAIQQGGELVHGGQSLNGAGYYYPPTIVKLEHNTAAILQEEIFGPVAMITTFFTQEEAITLANNTDAGLASYIFSTNEATLNFFAEKLEFGEVQLNGAKYDIYLPHGGVKNSGIGVDCSPYALDDYLIKKRVTKALID